MVTFTVKPHRVILRIITNIRRMRPLFRKTVIKLVFISRLVYSVLAFCVRINTDPAFSVLRVGESVRKARRMEAPC